MAQVIGIRFKDAGKMYYFDPGDDRYALGDLVIVETARGVECGEVVMDNRELSENEITKPLKKVVRPANREDINRMKVNRQREDEAYRVCQEKIQKHGLDMKLISAEYTFDNAKILFYFSAEGRIDFRELVKDLASVFRTRIELRQIGVRDEAKMLGGLGICGRPFCCSSFLGDFQPVSIKMAKEQGLSLNPTKISGTCGRLMCCLKYEQDSYESLIRITPKPGTPVETPDGRGVVSDMNLLTGKLKVRMEDSPEAVPQVFHRRDVLNLRNPNAPRDTSEPFEMEDKKAEKSLFDSSLLGGTPLVETLESSTGGDSDKPAAPRKSRGSRGGRRSRGRKPSGGGENAAAQQSGDGKPQQQQQKPKAQDKPQANKPQAGKPQADKPAPQGGSPAQGDGEKKASSTRRRRRGGRGRGGRKPQDAAPSGDNRPAGDNA